MGRLSPGRYAGTPPSAANAAGTRLSKEIMVRKAPSFFIGTSPSRLYRACVCPTGVGAPRGGHAPPGAAAAPLARREGAIHRASRVRERHCRPPARLLPCSTAGAQQMFPGRAPILQWGIKKGDAQSFSVQEERTTPRDAGGGAHGKGTRGEERSDGGARAEEDGSACSRARGAVLSSRKHVPAPRVPLGWAGARERGAEWAGQCRRPPARGGTASSPHDLAVPGAGCERQAGA